MLYHRCPDCRSAKLATAEGFAEVPGEFVERVEALATLRNTFVVETSPYDDKLLGGESTCVDKNTYEDLVSAGPAAVERPSFESTKNTGTRPETTLSVTPAPNDTAHTPPQVSAC